jgi:hypothetical protein
VTSDLISIQSHSLKAGHDHGQYARDARNAGRDDIAKFFGQVMSEDRSARTAATDSCANSAARTTPARQQ